jgi:hypothetical protein
LDLLGSASVDADFMVVEDVGLDFWVIKPATEDFWLFKPALGPCGEPNSSVTSL